MSEHLLEMAKALVRVKDGKVEVLTDPKIRCCPLRQDLYGITLGKPGDCGTSLAGAHARSWACTVQAEFWSCKKSR